MAFCEEVTLSKTDAIKGLNIASTATFADPDAAKERLDLIKDVELVEPSDEAGVLAELLVVRLAVPASEARDALHIAIAAVNRIQFIVTWNFKLILNPHMQTKIANACREGGFDSPVICTPQQLLETENDS